MLTAAFDALRGVASISLRVSLFVVLAACSSNTSAPVTSAPVAPAPTPAVEAPEVPSVPTVAVNEVDDLPMDDLDEVALNGDMDDEDNGNGLSEAVITDNGADEVIADDGEPVEGEGGEPVEDDGVVEGGE